MSDVNWLEVLGWGADELEDLRFVGYAYVKQGKYDIAITFFQSLVVLKPDNAYDLQTLGAIYLEKGNNLMALSYLERSLKVEPNHPFALLNRATALFGLGYKRQAMTAARSLSTNPDTQIADQASSLILAFS